MTHWQLTAKELSVLIQIKMSAELGFQSWNLSKLTSNKSENMKMFVGHGLQCKTKDVRWNGWILINRKIAIVCLLSLPRLSPKMPKPLEHGSMFFPPPSYFLLAQQHLASVFLLCQWSSQHLWHSWPLDFSHPSSDCFQVSKIST